MNLTRMLIAGDKKSVNKSYLKGEGASKKLDVDNDEQCDSNV